MLGRALGTTTDSGRCVGLPAGGKERGQGEGRGEGGRGEDGGMRKEQIRGGGGCILRESPVFLKALAFYFLSRSPGPGCTKSKSGLLDNY